MTAPDRPTATCVRCRKRTDRPLVVAVIEAASGPGGTAYGCFDCAWRIYLAHCRTCTTCRPALDPAGQCTEARHLIREIRQARTYGDIR